MTTTIIGATGRVGSAVVRRLLETGQPLRAYVRDADKARRIFGDSAAAAARIPYTTIRPAIF